MGDAVFPFYSFYLSVGRPRPEQCLQAVETCRICGGGHHLDPAVRQIAREPGEPQPASVPRDVPAKPDPLHYPRHQDPAGHAGRRRARIASATIGMTEIAMIARITRVKFFRTTGMLPKKYPPSTKRPTQSTAPTTL